jgi:hypothetical protein
MLKLERLQEDVRQLTHMVVDGDLPGLFVVGPGGLGKTHAVVEALKERSLSPRVLNTHATAFGLYTEFHQCKDEAVVLMEDLEALYTQTPSLSLLRSVLWGPRNEDGSMTRTATWTTAGTAFGTGEEIPPSFEFRAGLVMTANRFPARNEIFASLKTRVPVVSFTVPPEDVFAFMRKLVQGGQVVHDGRAKQGIRIPEEDSRRVIDYLEAKQAVDLRMLFHSLALLHRHRDGDRWKRLLDTILSAAVPASAESLSTNGTHKRELPSLVSEIEVVADLCGQTELTAADRVRIYQEKTGKSRQSFFRRQKELRAEGGCPRS